MSKPYVHAKSSARRYGGMPEDYLDIHQLMDSSKSAIPSNLHRVMTHNSWFIGADGILEKLFGVIRKNSEGKEYSVRDIGEQHILEDFGMRFIPTPQDYLEKTPVEDWMNNKGGFPPSFRATIEQKKNKVLEV